MSVADIGDRDRNPTSVWKKRARVILTVIICGGAFVQIGSVSASPDVTSTRVRAEDSMTMVFAPQGTFRMGSNDEDADEQPVHDVYLDAYWIDQTEVTNRQYKKCVAAGSCTDPSQGGSFTRDKYYATDTNEYADFPVIFVDWFQADEYCKWVNGRLPTEAEWEFAARGTDGRSFPMGDTVNKESANYAGFVGDTTRVGAYPSGSSPYGVLDMAGNVWEWVNDWYGQDFYSRSSSRNPTGPISGRFRVLRGGSWEDDNDLLRSANRNWNEPQVSTSTWGFRCVQT